MQTWQPTGGADGQGATHVYNIGDIAWVLVSSSLVWIMTPGIGFFYSGLLRRKNALSMLFLSMMTVGVISFQVRLILCLPLLFFAAKKKRHSGSYGATRLHSARRQANLSATCVSNLRCLPLSSPPSLTDIFQGTSVFGTYWTSHPSGARRSPHSFTVSTSSCSQSSRTFLVSLLSWEHQAKFVMPDLSLQLAQSPNAPISAPLSYSSSYGPRSCTTP